MVSFYRYVTQFHTLTVDTFEEFLFKPHNWTSTILQQQTDFYIDSKGKQLINFVGRFETLHDDIKTIAKNIQLPLSDLPHENVSSKKDYRTIYTTKTIERVIKMVPMDIKLLKYKFE